MRINEWRFSCPMVLFIDFRRTGGVSECDHLPVMFDFQGGLPSRGLSRSLTDFFSPLHRESANAPQARSPLPFFQFFHTGAFTLVIGLFFLQRTESLLSSPPYPDDRAPKARSEWRFCLANLFLSSSPMGYTSFGSS